MEKFDEYIDLIDRYFEGNLSDNELNNFKAKLKADTDFAIAFETERDIVEGIQASGNQTLLKRLDHIHKKKVAGSVSDHSAKTVSISRRLRMLAAVLLVAVIAGFAVWQINRPPLQERIFMTYYETPSFESLTRGEPATSPEFVAAKTKFEAGEFQNALAELDKFLTTNPQQETALLMKGISLLETNNFDAAIEPFKAISSTSQFYDAATWYLGLIYIRQNKMETAKLELEKLVNGTIPTGPKRKEKARALLEAL